VVSEPGGPERLQVAEREIPHPGPQDSLIRQTAVGVNFIDVYFRTGLYKGPALPFVLGVEGAGVVEQLGAQVSDVALGDRVAYASVMGAYASHRLLPAARAVKLPTQIDEETAAAVMLKGMTAQYLLSRSFAVKPGHTVVFHSAAGGVGSLACQWARILGARVIGTVGNAAKIEKARQNGCHEVVLRTDSNWVARVRELTSGVGADVVYDSVGQATFTGSLDCLKPHGMLVSFGQSSGKVPDFDIMELSKRGSLLLTRPTLAHFIETRAELEQTAGALFSVLSSALRVEIGARFALSDAAQAHRALESGQTTGSTLLIPQH